MNYLIIFAVCIAVSVAQQSPYAFSTGTAIQLASRFQTNEVQESQQNGIDIRNRFGADSSSTVEPLPIDARGDVNFIKEIESWPREKQPFWYINYKQIEAARSRPQAQPAIRTRSSFASANGNDQLRNSFFV